MLGVGEAASCALGGTPTVCGKPGDSLSGCPALALRSQRAKDQRCCRRDSGECQNRVQRQQHNGIERQPGDVTECHWQGAGEKLVCAIEITHRVAITAFFSGCYSKEQRRRLAPCLIEASACSAQYSLPANIQICTQREKHARHCTQYQEFAATSGSKHPAVDEEGVKGCCERQNIDGGGTDSQH